MTFELELVDRSFQTADRAEPARPGGGIASDALSVLFELERVDRPFQTADRAEPARPEAASQATPWCREAEPSLEQSRSVASLTALSAAIEARDPYARGHASRVTVFAQAVARRLGFPAERLSILRLAALLHDVGKLAVPDEVLLKHGALTEAELVQVRRHPAAGARMLGSLGAPKAILPAVLHHHERWDGGGYPAGRAGEEIPLEARILCVADSFDAMTSTRPYRAPRSAPDALGELERCSGSQFDAAVVEAFSAAWNEVQLDVLVWQEAAAS